MALKGVKLPLITTIIQMVSDIPHSLSRPDIDAIVVRFFDEFFDLRPPFGQNAVVVLWERSRVLGQSRQCFSCLIRISIQNPCRDIRICFRLVPLSLHFVLLTLDELLPIFIPERLSADGNLSTIADPFSAQRIIPTSFVRTCQAGILHQGIEP